MSAGEIAELVAIGVAAGVLAGVFGVGGGILFVPALVFIADLPQLDAAATSLAAMVPVVAVGAYAHHRHGSVRWRAGIAVGVLSLVGVLAGAALAERLPERTLRVLFAALVLVTAVHLTVRAIRTPANGRGSGGSPQRGDRSH